MNVQSYACFNTDEEVLKNSSSGGCFYELAKYVLNNDGVVFGARFNEDWEVVHRYCESLDDIHYFMGSKYVQSKIGNTYKEAKHFLDEKRVVLFSGTPCQIAGLKCFLKKEYENLILVDFICHGVPSPLVWNTYLNENFNKNDILDINFRNKSTGWKTYSFHVKLKNGKEHIEYSRNNIYMKGFLSDLYLRPSCYHCKFKNHNRYSDITLGDLWGIENFSLSKEFLSDKGVSFITVRTPKGVDVFKKISNTLIVSELNFDEAASYNPALLKSVQIPVNRKKFYQKGVKKGIKKINKLTSKSLISRIKAKIKQILHFLKLR